MPELKDVMRLYHIPAKQENAAIDMSIQMAVDDLAEMLQRPVEEILPQFLQSRTGATLYNRSSKLWWGWPHSHCGVIPGGDWRGAASMRCIGERTCGKGITQEKLD